MTFRGVVFTGIILSQLIPVALTQRRHDPLAPLEIDQLRESAQEPVERLKLYVKFARVRLTSLLQVRDDPKVTDRQQQIHDHLQDFLDVYDELNDNVDTFSDRKADLRKALKSVIEADTEFQAKLRAFKDAGDPKDAAAGQYEFLLTNIIDTLDSSAKDHRDLLKEQEEAQKHKKK